jgi:hypothetical protein
VRLRESKGARGDPGAGAVGWDGRMGLSGVTGDARARATTREDARMGAAWGCGAAASGASRRLAPGEVDRLLCLGRSHVASKIDASDNAAPSHPSLRPC